LYWAFPFSKVSLATGSLVKHSRLLGLNVFNSKSVDLNLLVQGGQLYWAFPFSKVSLSSGSLVTFQQPKKMKKMTSD
jgi:hypothetical protein